jgi:tRNA A-37 threonylcarbamoyl transferase component Bud32
MPLMRTNAHASYTGLVGESAFDWPVEPLAAGGMAVVFQARDRRLPRDVILKHPRTHDIHGQPLDSSTRAQFENRLRSEALVLARLQHPSIVTIHELGRSDQGAPFCVLEKVEGRSLREVLTELAEAEKSDGRPRTRERVELISNLLSIAEALTAAHERGIVHRDVNPNNILVGPRGEATLIDWGLAKDLSGEETVDLEPDEALPLDRETPADGSSTIIAGTPPYVCLEQALGQPAHPSYDVYSFGATLYHVVAGHPPFADESPVSYLARLVNGERPPPANPRDPELSGIIDRAMASKVGARFTAAELWRALKEYLTGDLVFSHRYSLTGRAARWVRKNRAKTGLIAVVALAAVLAVVGWTIVRERTERSARLAAEAQSRAAAREADAERRRATAERERAEALHTAAQKDEEARLAQEEADRADKTSQTYKQLKEVADRKRAEADAAKSTADNLAATALKRAAEARDAQEKAEAEADRTRREAQESVTAIGRERDQALVDRQRAETERDQALAGRQRAEVERDDAIAGRQRALAERDQALQARQRAEAERDDLLRRLRELESAARRDAGP